MTLPRLFRRTAPRTDWTDPIVVVPERDEYEPFGDWDHDTLRQLAVPAEVQRRRPTEAEMS